MFLAAHVTREETHSSVAYSLCYTQLRKYTDPLFNPFSLSFWSSTPAFLVPGKSCVSVSLFPLSLLNFFLFLCMSDVQSPLCPSSLCLLPFPLPCMSMFSLSCHSLTLSPIPLSSYFSFSAWTFRIFMGRNQCKCCDTIPSSTTFLSLFFSLTCFDLTHPLAISPPPTPPSHLGFTVDLFRFIVVVHGSEHNQNHPLVQNKIKSAVTRNQDLGNADVIFCINPTSPSLLLSTHPSLTHTVSMSLCALSHFPYYPFLSTFSPSSIPLSSLPLAVYGRHHVDPASAQKELKRLRHRGSG